MKKIQFSDLTDNILLVDVLFFCLLVALLLEGAHGLSKNDVSPPPPINIIVIGGSSGMGKAAAIACLKRGGKALIISRSKDKIEKAADEIRSHAPTAATSSSSLSSSSSNSDEVVVVETAVFNTTGEDAIKKFVSEKLSLTSSRCSTTRTWDGLVISAAGKASHGPVTVLSTKSTRVYLFESKFWCAYHCAKHIDSQLQNGGGIVFVAGVLNRRPGLNCAPLASTNGTFEGLTRALALELGPKLRVNCLSPGFCDMERFDHMDPNKKSAMLANTADSLPLKRTRIPEDMGEAIYYLLTAKFCTGVILDVDGGHGNSTIRKPKQRSDAAAAATK